MNLFSRLIISALAIIIVSYLLPGVKVDNVFSAIIAAAFLALINVSLKPVLIFLTLPITIVTMGLFLLVINAAMILVASKVVDGFKVDGFWWALLFSIILSAVTGIFNALAKPESREN